MKKQKINELLASLKWDGKDRLSALKWDGINRLPTLIDSLKQINQFDLIEAGKLLGIEDPISAYARKNAVSICLRACAKNIARKRAQHQSTPDFKRLQAGDIA